MALLDRRLLTVAAALLIVGLAGPVAWSARLDRTQFVSVDELKSGDLCTALTVFSGSEITEFDVEIIGIVRNQSVGGDLIIGRASGGPLEQTGIMQGMSGSPVYLDGRLVGAMSGTWAYLKEPIVGITPIEEMLPALVRPDERSSRAESGGVGGGMGLRLMPKGESALSRIGWIHDMCCIGAGDAASIAPWPNPTRASSEPDPIAAPLLIRGAESGFVALLSETLAGSGFVPAIGSSEADATSASDLVPGSAVGVQLIGGDANWTAIGTLTYRDEDRILAFGHPLFNAGRIEMPLVGAYVHALLPLQSVSMKFASGTQVVGTLVQDRSRMVGGLLGDGPAMLPITMTVLPHGGEPSTFRFEVVRARPFASLFAGLASAGAVSQAAKTNGPAAIELTATVDLGSRRIEYSDVLYTGAPAFRVAGELGTLMDVLADNHFEPARIEAVDLSVHIREEERWASIVHVSADKTVYRPGEQIHVDIIIRNHKADQVVERIALSVPKSVQQGPVGLRVGGANEFHEWEAERLGPGLMPRSFDQLADLIGRSKTGNTIVAQLVSARPGVSLSGEEIKSVPARAALVMSAGASSGMLDRVESRVLDEHELTHDRQVHGLHELTLLIRED